MLLDKAPNHRSNNNSNNSLQDATLKSEHIVAKREIKKKIGLQDLVAGCRLAKEEKDVQLITNLVVFFT